jgi:hypothetical protein
MIKRLGVEETTRFCKNSPLSLANQWRAHSSINRENLQRFLNDVLPFLSEEIQVRVEGAVFSIYCNDSKLFETMQTALNHWVEEIHSPANEAEFNFITENSHKKILCNKLPFSKYQYKISLKEKFPVDSRMKFNAWLSNYDGIIKTPTRVKEWLNGNKSYIINPTIYVKDPATISLVSLFLGDRISKIEEYIVRYSINTSL